MICCALFVFVHKVVVSIVVSMCSVVSVASTVDSVGSATSLWSTACFPKTEKRKDLSLEILNFHNRKFE